MGAPIRAVREAPKAVDLGLPSGTLWCDRNVGATAPEAAGLYFAWGETTGYKDAADRNAKLTAETGTTYSGGFDQTSYNRPGGASGITGNLSGNNDAATVNLGGSWRMPTKEEFQELINYTDITYSAPYVIFTSKADSTKSIKIHLSYIYNNDSVIYMQSQYMMIPGKRQSRAFIASSTPYSTANGLVEALTIRVNDYSVSSINVSSSSTSYSFNYKGFEIRPVQ